MSEHLKVGEYKKTPIYYDPKAKKFIITIEAHDVKQTLRSSSEISLRKLIEKFLEEPPLQVLRIRTYREIFKPVILKIVIRGDRVFQVTSNGKKRRIDRYDLRVFDQKIYEELFQVYEEGEKLKDQMQEIKSKLKKVEWK